MVRFPNVVLTGFMGTGKTTVGQLVAERLGFEFVDTDALIEQRHGPIPEIFRDQGEPAFRVMERDVAAELAERSALVVATGGAMMLDPENIASLGAAGSVFCLVADPNEIHRRVIADAERVGRPLLAVADPLARITELLAERSAAYQRFKQIPTDGRTPQAIADDIIAVVRPHHEQHPNAIGP